MNYSIWRNRAGLSPMKFYNIKIDAVKRTRKYEEADYQFVAADCELTAYDAEELRADLLNGDEIYFAVKDDAGNYLFRGTLQSEGTKYDAEKEQYTFSVVHIAKQLFGGFEKTYSRFPLSVWLNVPDNSLKPGIDAFVDAKFGEHYNTRSYLLDLCKVMGCVVAVDDHYFTSEMFPDIILNRVNLFSRKEIDARPVRIGFDDFVADYSYEDKKADYDYVAFPISFTFRLYVRDSENRIINPTGISRTGIATVLYSPTGIQIISINPFPGLTQVPRQTVFMNEASDYVVALSSLEIFIISNFTECKSVSLPERTLDLIPEFLKLDNASSGDILSYILPHFNFFILSLEEIGKRIDALCNAYRQHVTDYTEISVTYGRLIDADLLEKIAFQDKIISIREIEDDLQWEDRTIKGRIYKTQ